MKPNRSVEQRIVRCVEDIVRSRVGLLTRTVPKPWRFRAVILDCDVILNPRLRVLMENKRLFARNDFIFGWDNLAHSENRRTLAAQIFSDMLEGDT